MTATEIVENAGNEAFFVQILTDNGNMHINLKVISNMINGTNENILRYCNTKVIPYIVIKMVAETTFIYKIRTNRDNMHMKLKVIFYMIWWHQYECGGIINKKLCQN